MIGKSTFVAALGFAAALAAGVFAQEGPAPGGPGGAGGPGGPGARRGPDPFFARHDLDEDGKVTMEELMAPLKELMKAGDADGDGALTPEEFQAAREKLRAQHAEEERPGPGGPEGRPENGPEGRPGRGPEGRPGRGPEGRPGAGGPGGGPEGRPGRGGDRPDPEEIFKRMDTDGDGQISLPEFKAAHERMRAGRDDRRGPPRDR